MNWKTRIQQAKKRGYFERSDLDLSCNFNTCAVGECLGKDKDPFAGTLWIEVDHPLFQLGIDFDNSIRADDVAGAAATHKKIVLLAKKKTTP